MIEPLDDKKMYDPMAALIGSPGVFDVHGAIDSLSQNQMKLLRAVNMLIEEHNKLTDCPYCRDDDDD